MNKLMKTVVAVAVAAVGIAAMAEPKVEITRADVGNALDGIFAYTYNVSGVTGTCDIVVKIMADKGTKKKTDTISVRNGTGSYSVDTKALFNNMVYSDVAVFMSIAGDDSKLGGVQLWPNGPYWAICNVGADSPGDSGYYFWWGGTIGYRYVNEKWTDPYGVQADRFDTALCPTCKIDVPTLANLGWLNSDNNLKAWCDAATANLGAPWRTPTSDEIHTLVDTSYCKSTWTNLYGTAGVFIRGVKAGYTNKSIFLPAVGYGYGDTLNSFGSVGYYWSSMPNGGSLYHAFGLNFFSSTFQLRSLNSRSDGLPVRAVRD